MLMTGAELRKVFELASPFTPKGELKPESERVTILAANANYPFELQARAFAMASAAGDGSPIMVQLSHNSAETAAGDPSKIPPLPGVAHYSSDTNVVLGAKMAADQISLYAEQYNTPYIAVSLDHFKVPAFNQSAMSPMSRHDKGVGKRVSEARVWHAVEHMYPLFGSEVSLTDENIKLYSHYLTSEEYIRFKRDFVRIVEVARPAWGMIDTEHLPPVLDFVVTRDIIDTVRLVLGNHDIMIEAEFGATGVSGQVLDYKKLTGADLQLFADKVACFIKYTGADAIAYPIGMEHAAKKNVRHEPDIERLEVVQSTLYKTIGRYIPFAQHGGSGAAKVARGLVGKNNVNTHFLVAGATAIGEYSVNNIEGIRAGDKKYCGTSIFTNYLTAVAEAALFKLEEAGSKNLGKLLRNNLGVAEKILTASTGGKKVGAYDE